MTNSLSEIIDLYVKSSMTGDKSILPNVSLLEFKTLCNKMAPYKLLAEIKHLFSLKNADYLTLLKENDCFLLKGLFPDIPDEFYTLSHNNKYHVSSVLNHSLLAMSHSPHFCWIRRFTLLLHDLGKTMAVSIDKNNGDFHFYRHNLESIKIATKVLDRLNLSNEFVFHCTGSKLNIKDLILTLILHHDAKIPTDFKSYNKLYRNLLSSLPTDLILDEKVLLLSFWEDIKLCDILAHNLYSSQNLLRKIYTLKDDSREYIKKIALNETIKEMPISGTDILNLMKLKKRVNNRKIGWILNKAATYYHSFSSDSYPDKNSLLKFIEQYI